MTSARPRAEHPPPAGPRSLWLRPWLPVVVGAACFLNSLPNQYTYDDGSLIVTNPRLRDWTDVRAIWLSDWWEGVEGDDDAAQYSRDRLYRPLTLFTFAINHAVHGLSALGYHAVNVALHGLACWLVWRLTFRIVGSAAVAAVASLLFAVHPLHAEAVSGVVGRAELLAAVFLLAGALMVIPATGPPSILRVVAATPVFFLALLAKETAISFPAVILMLMLAALRDRPPPPAWWMVRGMIFLVPALVYLALRYVALDGTLLRSTPADVQMNPLAAAHGLDRVLGVFTVLGHYVRLHLVPSVLAADYGLAIIDPQRGFELMTGIGIAAALAAVWGAAQVLSASGGRRLVGALTLALLASYALVSNTVLLIGVAVAERLMYWPSVIACMLVGIGVEAFWTRHVAAGGSLADRARVLRFLGIALLAALAVRTIDRNWDWYDNYTLFGRDVQTFPNGAHLNICLARELHDRGVDAPDPREGRRLLELADRYAAAALQINPGFAAALSIRAQIQLMLGHTEAAEKLFESAVLLKPGLRDARRLLNLIRSRGADVIQAAIGALREEIATRPADVELKLELARKLLEWGDTGEARAVLELALELDPDRAEALLLHAKVAALLGDRAAAVAGFQRVLELAPDQWEAHTNLAMLLGAEDKVGALRHAEAALRLQPTDVRVRTNYAEALVLNGRKVEALEILRGVSAVLARDDPLRAAIDERIIALQRE